MGYLSLLIAPDNVAGHDVDALRGQWRPANTVNWLNSGEAVTNLSPGTYGVEFKPLANYVTPPSEQLVVFADEGTRITGIYYCETETAGAPPSVVSFLQATTIWRMVSSSDWVMSHAG